MTKPSAIDLSEVNIEDLLAQRRQIAAIWGIEDVQQVRPDLSDDQAWQVLQACDRRLDSECGLTWDSIQAVADELFPAADDD